MADMHHLVELHGVRGAAVYEALTTGEGITGWWTSRAEVPGAAVGDILKMSFPEMQMTWDMRLDRADPSRIEWGCVGGPPGWPATQIVWDIGPAETTTVVRLDHTGFASVDDMFRTVTVGWAQMLLSLKAYLETGVRAPFFDF
jgi:uncharacterized protein YndB with AHSA1/START domain